MVIPFTRNGSFWSKQLKLLVITVSMLMILNGCEGILMLDLAGDGNIITQRRPLNAVTSVELVENFHLEIFQSESKELFIESDSNLVSFIETLQVQGKLTIRVKNNFTLSARQPIKLRLYINNLLNLDVSGGGTVLLDTVDFPRFEIKNLGAAHVSSRCITSDSFVYYSVGGTSADLNGRFNHLSVRQLGSGLLELAGTANQLKIIQEGSGKVDARNLIVPRGVVFLFGSGLVFLYPTENLDVKINGKGRVYYSGNPTVSSIIEGGGALINEAP